MKNLLLESSVKAVLTKDRLFDRATRVYDREEGASLVEQILITVFIAVAVVAIMAVIVNALTAQGNKTGQCITNPDGCTSRNAN